MPNTNDPNDDNSGDEMPRYGTAEYVEWYRRRFPDRLDAIPKAGQPGTPRNWVPPQPSHKKRNISLGVVGGTVAVIALFGGLTSGGQGGTSAASDDTPIFATTATTGAGPANSTKLPPPIEPDATPKTTPTGPKFEPSTHELRLTTTDGGVAILRLTKLESRTTDWPAEYEGDDMAAPKYGRFVAATLNIQCTKGSIDYNPFEWQYEAPNGQLFDQDNGNSTDTNFDSDLELGAGTLHAGQQVEGTVLFDVPAGTSKLEYSDFTGTLGGWTVSVK